MFFAPAILILGSYQTTSIYTDIYFADSKVGSNHYEATDTKIESVSKLILQGLDIQSKLTMVLVDKKPIGLTFEESMTQGGTVMRGGSVVVKDGKMSVTSNGAKAVTDKPIQLNPPFFANFHPQICSGLYSKIKWDQKSKQDVSVMIIEGMANIPLSITPTETKTITTSDGTVNIKLADVGIATVKLVMAFTDKGDYLGMDVPSQKLRLIRRGYEAAFQDPLSNYPELSQPTFGSKTLQVEIPLRDGVVTKATIVRPDKPGKYPVILERTPYNRLMSASDGDHYAKRGYVFVVQDVRGTGESKGTFDPMVTERKDGYDTIDWISKQDWCDGNVGMIGASYVGFVQWAAAVEKHPALKCIVPQVSPPSSAMWNLPYENGVFTLLQNLWWLRIVDNPEGENMFKAMSDITNMKGLLTVPISQTDQKMLGFHSKIFTEWLKRDNSTKWPGWDFDTLMPKVTIPALHISGWFDGDEIGTQRNWQLLASGGNKNQWLIYGPWTHFFNTTTKVGNVDFGKDSMLELDSLYLRWFDTWLKGQDVGLSKVPKVNTGPKSVGRLVSKIQKDTLMESIFDPSKSKIGTDSMKVGDQGEDIYVKNSVLTKDIISLRTDPFESDKIITGPVSVEFDFKSSAKDTDFYATGFDEDPVRGNLVVFRAGKLKASYLQGLDRQRFLTPGQTYHAKLQLWDGANLFRKGHRLTLMITQSQFPASARNLGTTEPILTGTKMVEQRNVIFSRIKSPGLIRFRVIN